mmetsp:Transcript_19527/g.29385  ORF Transcript_19527/g.29385 Transcript_19527/m.29385 type:complete len:186 (+) Transcript_19527:68-625(+)
MMIKLVIVFAAVLLASFSFGEAKLPFVPSAKEYTPLIFFKLPRGTSPQCEAMEKIIKEIEKELGVKVDRMDVGRDMAAGNLFNICSKGAKLPPVLYHRESKQSLSLQTPQEGGKIDLDIDKNRVRAWAKGRRLQDLEVNKDIGSAPVVVESEEEELAMEAGMTPLQRKGKDAIKERTKTKSSRRS